MPLFKEEKYNVKGDFIKIRYNIDGNGVFWCAIKPDVMQATGLSDRETADTFKELEDRVSDAIYKWRDIETVTTYHIIYRLALSTSLRRQIPDEIMDREDVNMWEKTARIGSEYFPDDSTCMIFEWIPIVRKVCGTETHETILKLATDDTFHMSQAMKAMEKGEPVHGLHTGSLCKPFENTGDLTIFEHDGNYWNFNDQHRLEIPMTRETFDFFSNVDTTLLRLVTGMLGFLSQEPEKLMNSIKKAIESGNMNLLGFKG